MTSRIERAVFKGVHKRTVRKNGRVYTYYYHRETGERLPDDPSERAARVYAINHGPGPEGSLSALVEAYRQSPDFARLSDNTKRDYTRWLNLFEQGDTGRVPVQEIDREFALGIRDSLDSPRMADYAVQVLSVLCSYALDRPRVYGLSANPCQGIKKRYKSDGYKLWPEDLIEAFREAAYPELRAVFEGLLHLGQRPGDTIALTWPQYDGAAFRVKQSKTGAELWLPVHPDFRNTLNSLSRTSVVVFTTASGRPWKTNWLAREVGAVASECAKQLTTSGLARDAVRYTPHGLRKNAATKLAEAGATDAEIMAITGHKTSGEVRRYTAKAEQKRLAQSAIRRLK